MSVGGGFSGISTYMSYSNDKLRKENGLTEVAPPTDDEMIRIIHAPSTPPVSKGSPDIPETSTGE